MAPALTEAAGQAQKLKLKLPFAPPTTIPSARLIAPTRTYRRNNNNNNNNNHNKKDVAVLDDNVVDAETLEKLLLVCPVADIDFDDQIDQSGDVSSQATPSKKAKMTTGDETRINNPTSGSSPSQPSCNQCKPAINGGIVVNEGDGDHKQQLRQPGVGQNKDNLNSTMGGTLKDKLLDVPQWPAVATVELLATNVNDEQAAASRALAEKTTARERFQDKLERRARRLVRRMCRLRVTQASQHVSRQLLEFVCHQKKGGVVGDAAQTSSVGQPKHPLLDAILLQGTSQPSTSSTRHDIEVRDLLRRLESGHNEKLGGVRVSNPRLSTKMTVGMGKLDVSTCDDMEWTCGSLLTDIGYLDREVDSDATASSSGGESTDEENHEDHRTTRSIPIHKRAFWKWAVDRAAVVSRWTWLQAQVSDLEYRIRQTGEIHRQIRRMKDGPSNSSSTLSRDKSPSQVNGFVSKGGDNGNCCRTRCPTRPAFKRLLVRTSPTTPSTNTTISSGRQHLSSSSTRKVLRPSTVRCSCVNTRSQSTASTSLLPAHSCVLCGTRGSPGVPIVDNTMSRSERVALLDASFHSVLSFPRDISLAIHFEALLKSNERGKSYLKSRTSAGVKKKARAMQINDHARNKCRKLKKNATVTLTARLRKISKSKPVSGNKTSDASGGHRRLRKRSKRSSTSRRRVVSDSSAYSSQNVSPVPSPELGDNSSSQASGNSGWGLGTSESRRGSGGGVLEMLRRKRGESEYDIDNIVIPYSMAASTRVERLQYKEILTPKWRAVPECDLSVRPKDDLDGSNHDGREEDGSIAEQRIEENGISDDDQKEDVSEVTVVQRHDRCELAEKKRFLGFMKKSKPGVVGGPVKEPGLSNAVSASGAARRTRSMRSDSRADSSGTNTPDPMSPQPSMAVGGDETSLILSPPLSTLTNNHEIAETDEANFQTKLPSMLSGERRRTTSLSKRDRMIDDVRVCTPTTGCESSLPFFDQRPYVPVTPWELRTFPLRDIVYDEMLQESSVTADQDCPRPSSSSSSNCDIPENEWNGIGGELPPTATRVHHPIDPSPIVNHYERLDCSESNAERVSQQHDLIVK